MQPAVLDNYCSPSKSFSAVCTLFATSVPFQHHGTLHVQDEREEAPLSNTNIFRLNVEPWEMHLRLFQQKARSVFRMKRTSTAPKKQAISVQPSLNGWILRTKSKKTCRHRQQDIISRWKPCRRSFGHISIERTTKKSKTLSLRLSTKQTSTILT